MSQIQNGEREIESHGANLPHKVWLSLTVHMEYEYYYKYFGLQVRSPCVT